MLWISSFHGLFNVLLRAQPHISCLEHGPSPVWFFRLPMRIKKHTFVSVSPGSLWSHDLRYAGDGWCWDHVRPEEELLRHRGWRLTLGFHDCSWTWSEVFSHYAPHAKPTRPQNDFLFEAWQTCMCIISAQTSPACGTYYFHDELYGCGSWSWSWGTGGFQSVKWFNCLHLMLCLKISIITIKSSAQCFTEQPHHVTLYSGSCKWPLWKSQLFHLIS